MEVERHVGSEASGPAGASTKNPTAQVTPSTAPAQEELGTSAIVWRIGEMFAELGVRIHSAVAAAAHNPLEIDQWQLCVETDARENFYDEVLSSASLSKVIKVKPSSVYLIKVRVRSARLDTWGPWSAYSTTRTFAPVVTAVSEIGEDYVRVQWDRPLRDSAAIEKEEARDSMEKFIQISCFELRIVRESDMFEAYCETFPTGVRTHTVHGLRPGTAHIVFVRYATLIGTIKQWTEVSRFFTQAAFELSTVARGEDQFTIGWSRPALQQSIGYLLPDTSVHKFEVLLQGEECDPDLIEFPSSVKEHTFYHVKAGGIYSLRLRCLTKEGRWGSHSTPLVVRTADQPDVFIAARTESIATVCWSRPQGEPESKVEFQLESATSRYTRHVEVDLPAVTPLLSTSAAASSSLTTTTTRHQEQHLTGLVAGTRYRLRLRTFLSGVWGLWTNPVEFSTQPRPSLRLTERGENFFSLSWAAVPPNHRYSVVVTKLDEHFKRATVLEAEVTPPPALLSGEAGLPSTEHGAAGELAPLPTCTYRVGSLDADATYEVRVRAWQSHAATGAECWGEYTPAMTVRTLQALAMQVLDVGEDFAQLSWKRVLRDAPSAAGPKQLGASTNPGAGNANREWMDLKYEIVVGCLDTGDDKIIHREVLETVYTITNLLPATSYTIAVRACDENEQWGMWRHLQIRTLAAVVLTVHEIGEDFTRVLWRRQDPVHTAAAAAANANATIGNHGGDTANDNSTENAAATSSAMEASSGPETLAVTTADQFVSEYTLLIFSEDDEECVPQPDTLYKRGGSAELQRVYSISSEHTSMRINGLMPDRVYCLVIRAATASGKWGLWCKEMRICTVAPFRIPANSLSIGENYVNLTWARDERPVVPTDVFLGDYTVLGQQLRVTGVDSNYLRDHTLEADQRGLKLYGLQPATAYSMQIRVCNRSGDWGLWSVPVNIMTRATIVCKALEVAEDYLCIGWDRKIASNPRDYPTGKGFITQYHLRVIRSNESACFETYLNDETFRISDLEPNTFYLVEVKANYNDEEWGLWSSPLWCLTMNRLDVKITLISEEFCNVRIVRPPQEKRLPEDDGFQVSSSEGVVAFGQMRPHYLLCVTAAPTTVVPYSSVPVKARTPAGSKVPPAAADEHVVFQVEMAGDREELLCTIPGLKSNAVYSAAARSRLREGEWGMWSALLRFITLSPISISFNAVGENFVDVQWSRRDQAVPSLAIAKGMGIITKSRLKIRDLTGGFQQLREIDGNSTSLLIDDLLPATTYSVAVQTLNDNHDWGVWCDEIKVRTVSAMVVNVEHIGEESVWLSWLRRADIGKDVTPDTVLNVDTIVKAYELTIQGEGGFAFRRELQGVNCFFRGLAPDSIYEVRLRSLNKAGNWGPWAVRNFRTLPTMRVTFGNIGEDFAVVEWRRHLPTVPASAPHGIVDGVDEVEEFRLKVQQVGRPPVVYQVSHNVSSMRLSDLHPSSEYRVWLCAKGHEGVWGIWNQETRVRTLPQIDISIDDIGEDYVSVNWRRLPWLGDKAEDENDVKVWEIDGAVSGYQVRVADENGKVVAETKTGFQITKSKISHLELRTVYTVSVRAKDSYNEWGLWSNAAKFATLQPVIVRTLRIGENFASFEWDRRTRLRKRYRPRGIGGSGARIGGPISGGGDGDEEAASDDAGRDGMEENDDGAVADGLQPRASSSSRQPRSRRRRSNPQATTGMHRHGSELDMGNNNNNNSNNVDNGSPGSGPGWTAGDDAGGAGGDYDDSVDDDDPDGDDFGLADGDDASQYSEDSVIDGDIRRGNEDVQKWHLKLYGGRLFGGQPIAEDYKDYFLDADTRTFTVEELVPLSTYTLALRALNSKGEWGQWSEHMTVQTMPLIVTSVSYIGEDFSTLSWERPPFEANAVYFPTFPSAAGVHNYQVAVQPLASEPQFDPSDEQVVGGARVYETSQPSLRVANLRPGTRYKIVVREQKVDENGELSSEYGMNSVARITETVEPMTIETLDIGENFASIKWRRRQRPESDADNGSVSITRTTAKATSFEFKAVRVDENGESIYKGPFALNMAKVFPVGVQTYVLSNLLPNVVYAVSVRAQTEGDHWGHWSLATKFVTQKRLTVRVELVNEDNVLLSWLRMFPDWIKDRPRIIAAASGGGRGASGSAGGGGGAGSVSGGGASGGGIGVLSDVGSVLDGDDADGRESSAPADADVEDTMSATGSVMADQGAGGGSGGAATGVVGGAAAGGVAGTSSLSTHGGVGFGGAPVAINPHLLSVLLGDYTVQMFELVVEGIGNDFAKAIPLPSSSLSTRVSNLKPNSIYSVSIRSKSSGGRWSLMSPKVLVCTLKGMDVRVGKRTENLAYVSWSREKQFITEHAKLLDKTRLDTQRELEARDRKERLARQQKALERANSGADAAATDDDASTFITADAAAVENGEEILAQLSLEKVAVGKAETTGYQLRLFGTGGAPYISGQAHLLGTGKGKKARRGGRLAVSPGKLTASSNARGAVSGSAGGSVGGTGGTGAAGTSGGASSGTLASPSKSRKPRGTSILEPGASAPGQTLSTSTTTGAPASVAALAVAAAAASSSVVPAVSSMDVDEAAAAAAALDDEHLLLDVRINSSTDTVRILGLLESTTYEFCVRSKNLYDEWGPWSPRRRFDTLAPLQLCHERFGEHYINLYWMRIPEAIRLEQERLEAIVATVDQRFKNVTTANLAAMKKELAPKLYDQYVAELRDLRLKQRAVTKFKNSLEEGDGEVETVAPIQGYHLRLVHENGKVQDSYFEAPRKRAYTATGLSPNTMYVAMMCVNYGDDEWGTWSAPIKFMTQNLLQLSINYVGESFVDLEWKRAVNKRPSKLDEGTVLINPTAQGRGHQYEVSIRFHDTASSSSSVSGGGGAALLVASKGEQIDERRTVRDRNVCRIDKLRSDCLLELSAREWDPKGEWGLWSTPQRCITLAGMLTSIREVGENWIDFTWTRRATSVFVNSEDTSLVLIPVTSVAYFVKVEELRDNGESVVDASTSVIAGTAAAGGGARSYGDGGGGQSPLAGGGANAAGGSVAGSPSRGQQPQQHPHHPQQGQEEVDGSAAAVTATAGGGGGGVAAVDGEGNGGANSASNNDDTDDIAGLLEANDIGAAGAGGRQGDGLGGTSSGVAGLAATAAPVESGPIAPDGRYLLIRRFSYDVLELRLEDLKPDRFYSVQVMCETAAPTSDGHLGTWSSENYVVTPPKIRLRPELIDERGLRVSWARDPPRVHPRLRTKPVSGSYFVRDYELVAKGLGKVSSYSFHKEFAKHECDCRLSDLRLNSVYSLSIRSRNTDGEWSLWSDTLDVVTLNPLRIIPGKVSENFAVVEWGRESQHPSQYPPTESPLVIASEKANLYHLRVFAANDRELPIVDKQFPGTTTKFHMTYLTPNTAYLLQARSCNVMGEWGSWSEERVVYTQKLMDLSVLSVGEDYIMVNWHRDAPDELQEVFETWNRANESDVDEFGDGAAVGAAELQIRKKYPLLDMPEQPSSVYCPQRTGIVKYGLNVRKADDGDEWTIEIKNASDVRAINVHSVRNLRHDSQYTLSLRACYGDDDDWGLWSKPVNSGTLNLLQIDVKAIGEDYLTAVWVREKNSYSLAEVQRGKDEETVCYQLAVQDFTEVPIGEEVHVKKDMNVVRDALTASKQLPLKALKPNSRYRLSVRRWYKPVAVATKGGALGSGGGAMDAELLATSAAAGVSHSSPSSTTTTGAAGAAGAGNATGTPTPTAFGAGAGDPAGSLAVPPSGTTSPAAGASASTAPASSTSPTAGGAVASPTSGPATEEQRLRGLIESSSAVAGGWSEGVFVLTLRKMVVLIEEIAEDCMLVRWDRDPNAVVPTTRQCLKINAKPTNYHVVIDQMTPDGLAVEENGLRSEQRFNPEEEAFRLDNLTPDTPYRIAVRCQTDNVWGLWSEQCFALTLSKIAVSATSIGEDYVNLSWERKLRSIELPDGRRSVTGNSNSIEKYELEMFGLDHPFHLDKKFKSTRTTYRVKRLEANMVYTVTVRSCDASNTWSLLSDRVFVATLKPIQLSVGKVGEQFAHVSWSRDAQLPEEYRSVQGQLTAGAAPVGPSAVSANAATATAAPPATLSSAGIGAGALQLGNATVLSYHLCVFSMDHAPSTAIIDKQFTSDVTHYRFTGLNPNTSYIVIVRACNTEGHWGLWSEEKVLTTLKLIQMHVVSIGENYINVKWSRDEGEIAPTETSALGVRVDPTMYHICVTGETTSIDEHFEPGKCSLDGDFLTNTVLNLTPDSRYIVTLQACYGNEEWGLWTRPISFVTLNKMQVWVSNVTEEKADLSWARGPQSTQHAFDPTVVVWKGSIVKYELVVRTVQQLKEMRKREADEAHQRALQLHNQQHGGEPVTALIVDGPDGSPVVAATGGEGDATAAASGGAVRGDEIHVEREMAAVKHASFVQSYCALSDLLVNTEYHLQVRSQDQSSFWGEWSEHYFETPPPAPTNLTLKKVNTQLLLSWTPPDVFTHYVYCVEQCVDKVGAGTVRRGAGANAAGGGGNGGSGAAGGSRSPLGMTGGGGTGAGGLGGSGGGFGGGSDGLSDWKIIELVEEPFCKVRVGNNALNKIRCRVKCSKMDRAVHLWSKYSPVAALVTAQPPPAVPHLQVTSLSRSTAVVEWSRVQTTDEAGAAGGVPTVSAGVPNGGRGAASHGQNSRILYRVMLAGPRSPGALVASTRGNTHEFTDLHPSTTYSVQIQVESELGLSAHNLVLTFTTKPDSDRTVSSALPGGPPLGSIEEQDKAQQQLPTLAQQPKTSASSRADRVDVQPASSSSAAAMPALGGVAGRSGSSHQQQRGKGDQHSPRGQSPLQPKPPAPASAGSRQRQAPKRPHGQPLRQAGGAAGASPRHQSGASGKKNAAAAPPLSLPAAGRPMSGQTPRAPHPPSSSGGRRESLPAVTTHQGPPVAQGGAPAAVEQFHVVAFVPSDDEKE